MATSYWEMVAAFVNRGLLNEELFFDTHGEDIVVWNKIKGLVPDARKQIQPPGYGTSSGWRAASRRGANAPTRRTP